MEQARVFIAIALSFLVFFLWETFFVDKEVTKPAPQSAATVEEIVKTPSDAVAENSSYPPTAVTEAAATQEPDTRKIIVKTKYYTAVIDERGAIIRHFELDNYRETNDKDSPLLDVVKSVSEEGTLSLLFDGSGIDTAALSSAVYRAQTDQENVTISAPTTIAFVWTSPSGVVIEKRFHFDPEKYAFGMDVVVNNRSAGSVDGRLGIAIETRTSLKQNAYGFQGPCVLVDGNFEQIEVKKIADKDLYEGNVGWIAVQNQYFMSALIPESGKDSQMKLSAAEDGLLVSRLIHPRTAIASGQSATFKHQAFFGPKSTDILKSVGHEMERAVNFGMFDILAKPCLALMNFFYGIVPNYGIAIIVMTILIKIVLWPLGNKSYKSMSQMKKMQPLMAEIREKNKNDKKKQNEELMNLYKVYKINPMGGCLPMILQIPVFFALYRMLYEAIELRHAPFFGWITDLSAPDRLFNFGFSIPFMEPPYGIPVLTLVMGATMFLQQKMSPPPGDPTQAKMMMFMPIIFTFIFINFSSGLVLYWLVNNVLSIAQQYHVQKKYA
ncbi:MAG: membrane protein insertase YidC [Pseudomonadota bacterium]